MLVSLGWLWACGVELQELRVSKCVGITSFRWRFDVVVMTQGGVEDEPETVGLNTQIWWLTTKVPSLRFRGWYVSSLSPTTTVVVVVHSLF